MSVAKSYREELADFLRTRRARLSPAQVGLPAGAGYRRTPGLRREEVAQLAGVGLTWYTWLEQGRDIGVSAQVLEALVQALQLSPSEREHLHRLAQPQSGPERHTARHTISSALQNFMDSMESSPAFVIGPRWDVLAWNRAALAIYANFDFMRDRELNIVWHTFVSPDLRCLLVDWEGQARRLLAQFRASSSAFVGEAWLVELVEALNERSPEFRTWWSRHDVLGNLEGYKELDHPRAGRLVMEYLTFTVQDAPDLTLVVYNPTDKADTKAKLAALLKNS